MILIKQGKHLHSTPGYAVDNLRSVIGKNKRYHMICNLRQNESFYNLCMFPVAVEPVEIDVDHIYE